MSDADDLFGDFDGHGTDLPDGPYASEELPGDLADDGDQNRDAMLDALLFAGIPGDLSEGAGEFSDSQGSTHGVSDTGATGAAQSAQVQVQVGDHVPPAQEIVPHDAEAAALQMVLLQPPVLSQVSSFLRREGSAGIGPASASLVFALSSGGRRYTKPPKMKETVSAILSKVGMTAAHMSLFSLSQLHKVPPVSVRSAMERYFAAMYFGLQYTARRDILEVCRGVVASGGELLVYSEIVSYDETPLPLRVKASEDIDDLVLALGLAGGGAGMGPVLESHQKDACAKIVQTEFVVSMLVHLAGQYTELHLEVPCLLQVAGRGTGEVYAAVQSAARPPFEDIAALFARSDRHVLTDMDGSVLRAERALTSRGPKRSLCHHFCRIHRISKIATKGPDVYMGDTVSSIIRIALSLQSASSMKVFRRCLREVIARSLVICRGSPGVAADAYRTAVLNLFCPVRPSDHASAMRRRIVEACASGNYQRRDRFEVHIDGNYCEAEVLHFVCKHFVKAVAGRSPRVYPRHRWTGASQTLECPIGLLFHMHALFPRAYALFAQANGVSVRAGAPRGEVLVLEDAPRGDLGCDDGAPNAEARRAWDSRCRHWVSEWVDRFFSAGVFGLRQSQAWLDSCSAFPCRWYILPPPWIRAPQKR